MKNKFKRILILGNGGSGKSTLARKLNSLLSIPILHLDKIYWAKNWVKYNSEEFDKKVLEFINKKEWIIEGTPMQNIDFRISRADTIIFMDFNKFTCIFRIFKRNILSLFNREITNDGCPAINLNYKTLAWVWKFNIEKKSKIINTIKICNKNVSLYIIKSNVDYKNFLDAATKSILIKI